MTPSGPVHSAPFSHTMAGGKSETMSRADIFQMYSNIIARSASRLVPPRKAWKYTCRKSTEIKFRSRNMWGIFKEVIKLMFPPNQCIILRHDCLSSMKAITLISDYQDLQDPEELYQFVGRSEEVPGTFVCSICKDFKASRRGLVRNHVESIHFRGVFRYRCDICDKDFQGRNALAVHNSSLHPTRPKAFPAQVDVLSPFPKIPKLF